MRISESDMGADCCGHSATFEGLSEDYKRRLWLVITINAIMFLVEMGAGALAGSQALQADALDFLVDATTYGISLAVVGTSIQIRARAAILKALSLTAMALWVLGSTAYHVLILGVPRAENNGSNRYSRLGRQRGQCPYSHAIQRWRCQRALRLVVFSQ